MQRLITALLLAGSLNVSGITQSNNDLKRVKDITRVQIKISDANL
jgi:hypothetical protein